MWGKDRALVMVGLILATLTQGSLCSSGTLSHHSQRVAPLPEAGPTPPRVGLFLPVCVLHTLAVCVCVCVVPPAVDRALANPHPSRRAQVIPVTVLFLSLCSPPCVLFSFRSPDFSPERQDDDSSPPPPPAPLCLPNKEQWKLNHFFPSKQPKHLKA